LRKLVIDYIRKIAVDIRGFLLPAVYGLCGGLAAVAFQSALNITFSTLWEVPSQEMGRRVRVLQLVNNCSDINQRESDSYIRQLRCIRERHSSGDRGLLAGLRIYAR
jgi:hypothetical protein